MQIPDRLIKELIHKKKKDNKYLAKKMMEVSVSEETNAKLERLKKQIVVDCKKLLKNLITEEGVPKKVEDIPLIEALEEFLTPIIEKEKQKRLGNS